MLLKLSEASPQTLETAAAVAGRSREGIAQPVELEESVESQVALGLGQTGGKAIGCRGGWEEIDEVADWRVEGAGAADGSNEGEAEAGGVLAAVEIVRNESAEAGGRRTMKGLFNRGPVRLEDLRDYAA